MALKFKGTVSQLPTEDVSLYDAYFLTGTGYQYCSAVSSGVPTAWSSYVPIRVIDALALTTTYEGSGAPTTTSNAVQFPTLKTGAFYLDGTSGAVYAFVSGTTGWQAW